MYKYPDGTKYEGEWKNEKKEGKGKLYFDLVGIRSYPNGDIYEGGWKEDQKSGQGIILYRV